MEAVMKVLSLYDGTLHAKTALLYGLKKVKEAKGELVVLQVFPASQFVDYEAGPRAEEMARQEAARFLREGENLIKEAGAEGATVRVLQSEGDPADETVRIAGAEKPDLLLAPARYKSIDRKAVCPVRLVPGTILVPVDNSDAVLADVAVILREARDTASKVLLLGIVPMHLYGPEEKQELEALRRNTAASLARVKKELAAQKIDVADTTRTGYPDEEIVKAADETGASLIMLPSGGKTPSELTKAAAILLDEPERVRRPIQLMPAEA
jgi:nucleotide-binding universal stress UspA family protein